MEVNTRLNAGEFQHKNVKEPASLIELLAAIVIGIFGIFLSELGIETNNIVTSILGFVIQFLAVGWIAAKLINEILDLINRFKKKSE